MSRQVISLAISLLVISVVGVSASTADAIPAEFSWGDGTSLRMGGDRELIEATTAGEARCNSTTGESSVSGTGSSSVTTSSITITDEGKEDKCRGPLGTTPSITMNGCQFRFNAGTTLGEKGKGESEGTMDIVNCIAITNSITTEAIGCIVHIPPQNGLGPVIYKTIAGPPEYITIELKITNLKYTHTGSLCGSGEGNSGSLTGAWTTRAFNGAGFQTNGTVT